MQVEKSQLDKKSLCAPNEAETKLDECIKNIINHESFLKYYVEKLCVSTSGGNYLSILYEVDVKGKTREGDKEINLFVKNIIPVENELKLLSVVGAYQTEVFVYKELLKIFTQLQDEANVPSNEKYNMVKVYDESNVEAIIMENVAKKGYSTCYRMDVVTLKFAQMAITQLAKFHALTFVLKEKNPDYFEKQIKTRKIAYIFCDEWRGFIQSTLKISMACVNEDCKEKTEKFCAHIYDRFRKFYEDKRFMRCLCHGDYKPNNIMMKMTNGEISVIPVDYQMLYYGCPVIDFMYFIFSCTDRRFRKAHLPHLKDLYHKTLTQFLNFFDIDVSMVYPREVFDMDYQAKLDYGLVMSLTLLPFIFASENDVPDMVNGSENISFKVDDRFKDRLHDVIEDYTEWGLI